MKKLSLIALLTLMMAVVSFNSIAQEVSTVMVVLKDLGSSYYIKTIDNNLEINETRFKLKDLDVHLALKKEVDQWLKHGYKISESTATSDPNVPHFSFIYILTKEE